MKTEKEKEKEIKRERKVFESGLGQGYEQGIQERNTEVREVINNAIKYFKKPETELNKAIVFYLKELLQKLGVEDE